MASNPPLYEELLSHLDITIKGILGQEISSTFMSVERGIASYKFPAVEEKKISAQAKKDLGELKECELVLGLPENENFLIGKIHKSLADKSDNNNIQSQEILELQDYFETFKNQPDIPEWQRKFVDLENKMLHTLFPHFQSKDLFLFPLPILSNEKLHAVMYLMANKKSKKEYQELIIQKEEEISRSIFDSRSIIEKTH
jgi:hypothetical protein